MTSSFYLLQITIKFEKNSYFKDHLQPECNMILSGTHNVLPAYLFL